MLREHPLTMKLIMFRVLLQIMRRSLYPLGRKLQAQILSLSMGIMIGVPLWVTIMKVKLIQLILDKPQVDYRDSTLTRLIH